MSQLVLQVQIKQKNEINLPELKENLKQLKKPLYTGLLRMSAHLIMPNGFNDELQEKLKNKFGIGHTTFQIENE